MNALANITILGVQQSVSNVSLDGMAISSGVSYDQSKKMLSITNLNNVTSKGAWASDWELKW